MEWALNLYEGVRRVLEEGKRKRAQREEWLERKAEKTLARLNAERRLNTDGGEHDGTVIVRDFA